LALLSNHQLSLGKLEPKGKFFPKIRRTKSSKKLNFGKVSRVFFLPELAVEGLG